MNRQQHLAWRDFVSASRELTPAHKLVLLTLSKFSDWPDGTNARPGVALLAKSCALSRRAVEAALEKGRRLALIEQTARANPKRSWASTYRLLPAPISSRTSVRVEAESKPDSSRVSVRIETGFQAAQNGFQPANHDVSTRTLVQPTKSSTPNQNTNKGVARDDWPADAGTPAPTDEIDTVTTTEELGAFGEQPHSNALAAYSADAGSLRERLQRDIPPPPARFCRRHMPDGPDGPCGPCGDARWKFTRWEKRYGSAWDVLHPPLMGKRTATAVGYALISEDLTARMRDQEGQSAPVQGAPSADYVDAEVIDEAPRNSPPCHYCTAPAVENGLCGRHLATTGFGRPDTQRHRAADQEDQP